MSKLPEWAVVGAEVVSDYGGVQVISRVSATSAWTKDTSDSGRETRWVDGYGNDSLQLWGADRWSRSYAYPTDRQPGKRLKRTKRLQSFERRIHDAAKKVGVRVNGQESLADLEAAARSLRGVTHSYLLFIQACYVEDQRDAGEDPAVS